MSNDSIVYEILNIISDPLKINLIGEYVYFILIDRLLKLNIFLNPQELKFPSIFLSNLYLLQKKNYSQLNIFYRKKIKFKIICVKIIVLLNSLTKHI